MNIEQQDPNLHKTRVHSKGKGKYIVQMATESNRFSFTELDYPAWCQAEQVPVTKKEIRNIFNDLTSKFGFQKSSAENMFHHLLAQLDSRASRSNPQKALISLHASYIGGDQANFKKWYFAAQLDLDEEIGFQNMRLRGKASKRNVKLAKQTGTSIKEQKEEWKRKEIEFINSHSQFNLSENDLSKNNYKTSDYKWKLKMRDLTPEQMVRQLALFLLCWGEANQIRFTPECLCFLYKCALDFDSFTIQNNTDFTSQEYNFLEEVISPIYNFLRGQVYRKNNRGKWVKRNKDHKAIIGYDDVNQLFWYPEGIERIVLFNGKRLIDIPKGERYLHFKDIEWSKVFYKTYRETRSWMHCLTNFNRFWIIHFAPFWFFTAFNSPTLYTKNYIQLLNNPPLPQVRFTIMALGGSITCVIQIFATLFEWIFVPREWPGAQHLTLRMIGLLVCLLINVIPTIYFLAFYGLEYYSTSAYILSIIQLVIAILTTIIFATRPLGGFFGSYLNKGKKKRRYISSQTFTASFPTLTGRSKWFSYGLWFFVFFSKFIESYFFLTLSLRDPIRVLSILDLTRCKGDLILGTVLCRWQSIFTLVLMLLSDLGLFFLDTYLWYIICNCIFSIIVSLSLGTSIFTPWKNIYSRLPKRIYSKILATSEMEVKFKAKLLVSQVWNAIIISMYREHLLSIEHVQKLLYQQVDSLLLDTRVLRSPTFFIAQDDSTYKSMEFFPKNSEAKRRISFFAQSLSTPISEPVPVECMPTFTVLVPHYAEKILLGLKEIIKEESTQSKIPVLEYLKQLHPIEWQCFIRDTKLLTSELNVADKELAHAGKDNRGLDFKSHSTSMVSEQKEQEIESEDEGSNRKNDFLKEKINDLPYELVGFSSSEPVYTLRTRIWASLRTQTLYRTITGFMNYAKAIELLYRIETPSMVELYNSHSHALQNDLNSMSTRKFRMLVAMQRYMEFDAEERESCELLLRTYPSMFISFLQVEQQDNNSDPVFYSCVTSGFAEYDKVSGLRKPLLKIRLSGNPILGDGKSDNQNHSLIFYRGEYIQVIDANQDNYLEECLKIRSILNEFEELNIGEKVPYIPGIEYEKEPPPVAIIGAREYIFSENIGVLGDIAAGKEQTFGTLFARTLAEIGGKLHYGHPDFINAIFMTTRGGISKAQRSLHLNEDIYAGINAMCRGGRIKHSDYYQCGKGRDLGFGSILNFTTKIGAGMGEQLLSREYYYLGTQLPIDRFLSFFYAHPGFHLNNLFISISLHLFFLLLVNLGSLNHEVVKCNVEKHSLITDLQKPVGCYNINPALHWVSIFVLSIFIVFFIAFAPLLIQELLEKGFLKATTRFLHHIFSMAPLFEVFVCQIYSNALLTDITFGGAKYISTGRGFAITRIDFAVLYSRFASVSIYSGFQIFLMLLFATMSMWQPALLWFWITVVSLCFAPFIFNPHQFSFCHFFLDYGNLIRWFSIGNYHYRRESWSTFTKSSRAKYIGYKRKVIDDKSEESSMDIQKTNFGNIFFTEVIVPFFVLICEFTAYTFINAQTGVKNATLTNSLLRLVIVTCFPIVCNMVILLVFFIVSFVCGPVLACFKANTGSTIAFVAHGFSVFVYVLTFEIMWFLEGWNFTRTLILLINVINFHVFCFKLLTILLLTREYKNNKSSLAWWSGKWYNTGMGWAVVLLPLREYFVKVMESSYFAGDFFLCHFLLYLQTPLILVPFVDYWHSMMLFWLKPTFIISKNQFFTRKEKKVRDSLLRNYILLYITLLVTFLILLICPFFAYKFVSRPQDMVVDYGIIPSIIQPNRQNNNDTGPNAPTTILTTTPELIPFKTVR